MRRVVILLAIAFLAFGAFGFYLSNLYKQLQEAFNRRDQFIPTRLYSDVTRIASPDPRSVVEERLRSLRYSVKRSGNDLSFNLHAPDYPIFLIPGDHPIASLTDAERSLVTLHFGGAGADASLSSIELNGKEIADVYLEPELVATLSRGNVTGAKREIRAYTPLEEIPARVGQAIISVEDHTFYTHWGINFRGIGRAVLVNLKSGSLAQGGSTISQQLVKNLMARRGKNVFKKLNEIFLTILLEAKFSKEQILERYLNEVNLGQVGSLEVHGVVEGAEHFFGKKPQELNLAEMAMMAGFIRSPFVYSPYKHFDKANERKALVLKKMQEAGYIAPEEEREALRMPIRLAPPQNVQIRAPYFADFVKAELIRQLKDRMSETEVTERGFRVYTTLDMPTNNAAQAAVADGLETLEKKLKVAAPDRLEGALASIDHSNGYIRALVGGRNYARSNFNRILNMKRQVGSTFKPIVYLSAFQKGADPKGVPYGPGHPADDSPWKLTYDHGRQHWSPRNYEKNNRGWIDYRTCLAHSINTCTAKLGWEVGLANVVNAGHTLGIESDLPEVPSLSLGVAELSPIELLKVYSTIANHGTQNEPTVIRAITEDNGDQYARFVHHPKEIFPAGPTDLLTDMLQTVFAEGTAAPARAMGFDRPAAGKTGTTSNYRDSWFAGYTPQLTTVVWVGMDQTPTRHDDEEPPAKGKAKAKKKKGIQITGTSGALPIWVDFMKRALSTEPTANFPLSSDLSDVQIDRHTGLQAAYNCPSDQVVVEKYVRGNEPKSIACEPNWPPSLAETISE